MVTHHRVCIIHQTSQSLNKMQFPVNESHIGTMSATVLSECICGMFKPGAIRAPLRMQDKCTFAQMADVAVVRVCFCCGSRGQAST
ncbi:Uncharacterised protein [Serratia fonticola]|nr:Uncharacterised protein [Serratia fonticola]